MIVPGPDTLLHARVKVPDGSESSKANPPNEAVAGRVMAKSGPALTTGGLFVVTNGGTEVMVFD